MADDLEVGRALREPALLASLPEPASGLGPTGDDPARGERFCADCVNHICTILGRCELETANTRCENCGTRGIDITVRLCPSCAFECPACRGQGVSRNGKDCYYCDASGAVTEEEAAYWPGLDR